MAKSTAEITDNY